MPFRRGIGRELTRSTICVRRSRAAVTLMCADRVPVAAADLLVIIEWTNFEDDVVLSFRRLNAAGGGDLRFDAADGPTSKTFPHRTRELVRIVGAAATTGADPDVMLDVTIEGRVVDSLPISVGPAATSVDVRAVDGVSPAVDRWLPGATDRLRAVPTPAGPGTFTWLTLADPAVLTITTPASADVAVVRAGSSGPDTPLVVAVLHTPAGGPAVMAVHRLRVLFNPEQPGPFPVGRTDYTDPEITIAPMEGVLTPIHVPLQALVRYPAEAAGVGTAVSAARPSYPLVILVHGRHGASEVVRRPDGSRVLTAPLCRPTPIVVAGVRPEFANHEGLAYLADHLASHGFIAISINLNGRYDSATGTGELARPQGIGVSCHLAEEVAIAHRALVILAHARAMEARNGADPLFAGRIDMDKVALVGHSRGGEAVVDAHVANQVMPPILQVNLRAVVSIAPTDSRGDTIDIPYLAIVGSDDGDVVDVNGLRIYDRARPPKYAVWLTGGIHNFFSSNWQWQDEVPVLPAASRAQHESLAKGYITVFLHAHVFDRPGQAAFFAGERRLAALAGADVHHSIQLPGGQVVDQFEDAPADATRNALTFGVTTASLARADEVFLNQADRACLAASPAWFHDTNGLMVEWSSVAGRYVTNLGGLDVHNRIALSFRVGQNVAGNPGGPQDFAVRLTDAGGLSAVVRVADVAIIPPPRTRRRRAGFGPACVVLSSSNTISFLKTVRLPLARFKAATPALDLHALASVTFEFTATASGKLAFDDLEFSD